MADAPATFTWQRGADGGALVEGELEPHEALLVADSWFVSADGRARALDAHRSRFLGSVTDAVAELPASVTAPGGGVATLVAEAEAFWGAAIERLRADRSGSLFPRVELALVAGGPRVELRLRVRAAPPRRETAVVVTHDGDDPRTVPRRKGPDLENLIALRAAGQENGADEVMITRGGLVVDASNAALLWWRGETLVAPSSELARVASITARSIRLIASATGTRVVEERSRPHDLEGCELWLVSALHGITVVELWIDGPTLAVRPSRAASWRRRLDALSRPV